MNEQMLYEYVRDKYVPDLQKSGDAFEYIDATSDQYRMKIELKCRQTHYDELILEKDKYDSLIQQAKKLGYTPFYINSTPKGIYAFNLLKVSVKWTYKRLPANSFSENAPAIQKEVALLHIDKAVLL